MAVKPKVSPQPTMPSSVVPLPTRESTVFRLPLPHAAGADFPPTVNGIRKGNVSIFSIFIFSHPEVHIDHKIPHLANPLMARCCATAQQFHEGESIRYKENFGSHSCDYILGNC